MTYETTIFDFNPPSRASVMGARDILLADIPCNT